MAGHSKWANIKRAKGANDAKRGKLFTKLIREIQVSARIGGGDVKGNPRLRDAVVEARANNMPKDNIERAIKRGTGELEGSEYVEVLYEAYGPGGIAILIDSMTDNRNRTVADLRAVLTRNGGSLGESGCVAWMFDKKGTITLKRDSVSEEEIMEAAIEAGAEDVQGEEGYWQVTTEPETLSDVKSGLEEKGLKLESAEISQVPKNTVDISDKEQAEKVLKLMDLLEDNDDVQKVHSNFDIPQELIGLD